MALRKQVTKDANKIPSGNQQIGNMQEDDALDDGDNNDELSSSLLSPLSFRDKRRRERENKSKPKEMTEEEMMDLALRLSEQEASITALRKQKEEEAMMKAIEESMDSQTQPCPSSQSLLDDAGASLRICSRRKLVYSNGKPISAMDQRASEDSCTPQTDLNRGAKRSGDGDTRGFLGLESNVNKKLRRKEGSPLLEMPDLSQTQKIDSQASPCSSDVPDLPLDSPQSSDSTQIEDCQLRKSPVFPLTGCRPEVHVARLTQDLLQTCRTSGFVWCSQDSLTSPQKLLLAQPKSPTFPKSHKLSSSLSLLKSTASPKSPIFSETDQGDDGETQPRPEYVKSPVFGRNARHEKSPSACKLQVGVLNSGFTFSSQESLASSLRSTTCQPKSPVFPRSPSPSSERSATCKSPAYSETDGGQTEQSCGHCTSPVSSRTEQKLCLDVQKHSASPSPAELRDSGGEGNPDATEGLSPRPRQDSESDPNQNVRLTKSSQSDDGEEELKETSKDQESDKMELTTNVTLLWSDEDDDVTPVGSPSPVFPEERPAHQADGQPASLDHVTAAPPGTTVLSRPSSSSPSSGRQQLSTTRREPISSQETVSGASAPPGSTVHYYWGVPFCPRGLDPDDYTQVILAQMEVYEKSLKQAQRCLLRKAEWGGAVLPQPEKSPSSSESPAESPQQLFPQRRGLRLRSKKLCDTDDAPPAEADEEEEEKRENKEEGRENEGEGQVDTDDCEICPETQLSDNDDDRTQDLMMDTDRGPELRPKSAELPEVEMILQNDSPAEEQQQDEEEVEVEVDEDQKTKGNTPVRSSDVRGQYVRKEEVEEDRRRPDVVETKDRGLQRSISPELELAVVPQNPETSMDCPICQGSFPVTEIEMHAAYCDGEVVVRDARRSKADSFQASLKPRRKRTRKAEATAEDPNDTSNPVRNQEKCYICQKLVPLRDYSRHTELCIHRQGSKTAAKENLLSALEKTESRNSGAGPSGSQLQPGDVIDLRDDDDDDDDDVDCEEGGAPAIRVSNSPIRSFTPISEATDCLIDFKKQYRTKKLSQRRR